MADESIYDEFGDACSILVPVDISGSSGAFVSATGAGTELPEDSSTPWSPSITYQANQRVHLASTHRVYESTGVNGNAGKDPSQLVNQFNASGAPTFWIDVGPTNKFAMFDGLISSQTVAPSPLSITLRPGAFSGLAMFNVEAESYSIQVKDVTTGEIIYNEENVSLEGTNPSDYYEYFFERFKPLKQFIKTDIPSYVNSEITITLYMGNGTVKLGMFAIGDMRPIGIPLRDARVEPQDFSYFKQDAFGNSVVKKRANATGMSISCAMNHEDAGVVLNTIKEVLGTPVVVVGSQAANFEWLTVFGLISGSMSPNPYPYATINLSVRGFI